MNYIYEDNLCLIKTNKYKTINLFFRYVCPYTLRQKLIFNLLGRFIGEYSNKYPTKEKMIRAKDMLYGASVLANCKVYVDLISLNIKYTFLNPRFTSDLNIVDFIEFVQETLENVYFSEELLEVFKRNYKDNVARYLDKPSSYANNRVSQIIGQDCPEFLANDVDHVDEIDGITLTEVIDCYEKLKENCFLNILLVGEYDEQLLQYLKKYQNNVEYKIKDKALDIKPFGEIIEEKEVSQSCLNVIYKTPYTRFHEDFFAFVLANALFGVVPTSLLFSEVREKLSLCYYIYVQDYKNQGLVKVSTAIDGSNKDLVVDKIEEQITRLINEDYDDELLTSAKTLFIDSLISTPDDVDAYGDYLFINKLNGLDIPLNDYIDGINKVTKMDVARVFKNYQHVLTYLLKGTNNE